MSKEKGAETPPKPNRRVMVNVVNTHRFRSFHLGQQRKIGPGQTGKIPAEMFEKIKDQVTWVKRAERGDVI